MWKEHEISQKIIEAVSLFITSCLYSQLIRQFGGTNQSFSAKWLLFYSLTIHLMLSVTMPSSEDTTLKGMR